MDAVDQGGNAGNLADNEAQENTAALTDEENKRTANALAQKMIAASFGNVVSILMRSPNYKHYSLSDLEWLVLPAITQNQFTMAEARHKETGLTTPVGVALWAKVSDEVDQRLSQNLETPLRLRPDEWNRGENYWLIDAIGPAQVVQNLVNTLRKNVFKDQPVKLRGRDEDGKVIVRVVGDVEPA